MDFPWCIIIPILAAIIGAILGWLLRNLSCGCDDEKNEIEKLKAKNNKLEADLKACLSKKPTVDTSQIDSLKAKNNSLQTDVDSYSSKNSSLQAKLDACLAKKAETIIPPVVPVSTNLGAVSSNNIGTVDREPTLNFDAGLARAAIGKKVIGDDLKVIEGIGPKIEQLFHEGGIKTWHQLSVASIEKCQSILNTGGKRYEIHNPSTWPKQAGLAFQGKWEELNTLQDRLDGGVDRG